MADEHTHEFTFTEQDFQRTRKLIYEYAGISLGENKRELVYGRLARRLRATGTKTFAEYLDLLQRSDKTEWEAFANSLTTNMTSFFREAHHFPMLAEHLSKLGTARQIVLWCSACATGEEAYSMAMTAVETLGGFDIPVRIVASDLDTNVLQTARDGRYELRSAAMLSAQQLDRFFVRGEGGAGFIQVRPELQKMISFKRLNLLDTSWQIHGQLDVIFCRNVMIYFDKNTQLAVLQKFAPLLRRDGLLFAGHSESFDHADALFKLREHTVYELAGKPGTDYA